MNVQYLLTHVTEVIVCVTIQKLDISVTVLTVMCGLLLITRESAQVCMTITTFSDQLCDASPVVYAVM